MGFWDALFPNIKLGINISNQVIKTLFKDKELFIYPLVMAVLAFALLIIVFVPFIILGGLGFGPLSFVVLLIVYYLITTFMATYFLFALYIAFKSFVQGKKIGMMNALGQAANYLPQIIAWTIFYTIVLTIVRLIESRVRGIAGFIVNAVIGIALFLGVTFAVPIIYEDKVGPIEAVKRSATFIINNIGKTFSGIIYFDIISFVIKIIGILFILGAIFAIILNGSGTTVTLGGFTILGNTSWYVIGGLIVIGIAIYIIGVLFNYVTLHIYYLVLYDYVKNGKVPKGMDESLIKSSIKKKATSSSGSSGGGGGLFGNLFQSSGNDSDTNPDMQSFVK